MSEEMRATRPRIVTITTIVVAGVSIGIGSPASAEFNNGGFESGLTGWMTIGAVGTVGSTFGTGPIAGDSSAIITNVSDHISVQFGPIELVEESVGTPTVETFLDVSAGSIYELNGLGGELGIAGAAGGSAIKQSFAVSAGDTISFDFNFLTHEGTSPFGVPDHRFDDFAFVSLSLDGVLLDLSVLARASDPGFVPSDALLPLDGGLNGNFETGVKSFSRTVANGGILELGIGVMDHGEPLFSSGVLVDNVAITPVPSPSSIVLFCFGGMSLLGCRIRSRQKTKPSA
jgi:hypothetical protein